MATILDYSSPRGRRCLHWMDWVYVTLVSICVVGTLANANIPVHAKREDKFFELVVHCFANVSWIAYAVFFLWGTVRFLWLGFRRSPWIFLVAWFVSGNLVWVTAFASVFSAIGAQ
jgi:hypothetical protein